MRSILILIFSITAQISYGQQALGLYHKALGDSLFATNNYSKALKHFDKALAKTDDKTVLLSQARCYFYLHDFVKAEVLFSQASSEKVLFTADDDAKYMQVRKARQVFQDTVPKTELQSRFQIKPLNINTPSNEFGAILYRDGIIFTASLDPKLGARKYHRDESAFVDLFYSKGDANGLFSKPEPFNVSVKNKHHNGPVSFYDNGLKMLLTKNVSEKRYSKSGKKIHLAIYQGERASDDAPWVVNEEPLFGLSSVYSYGQAFVCGDSVLYFVSDQPGGYGSTDIYKSKRSGDKWMTPENLGPEINSPGREMFPFVKSDGTLVIASDGHGGFGGLDIFEVGPQNKLMALPHPINSFYDDFGMVTDSTGTSGFFTSSRNSQDDLYQFHQENQMSNSIAYIFNSDTEQPLSNAGVHIFTASADDMFLVTNDSGYVSYALPPESAYVLVASSDDRSGMLTITSDTKSLAEKNYHKVPAFGDLLKVHAIGKIKDSNGNPISPEVYTVTDVQTGEKLKVEILEGLTHFRGEKGHDYKLTVFQQGKDSLIQILTIPNDAVETYSYDVVLNDRQSFYSAYVFQSETKEPIRDADVQIISTEEDKSMRSDSAGNVNYSLPEGTAYLLIASSPGRSGMLSAVSTRQVLHHDVPVTGDADVIHSIGRIINTSGEPVSVGNFTIVDLAKGEEIKADILPGLIYFPGKAGNSYTLKFMNEEGDLIQDTVSFPDQSAATYQYEIQTGGKNTSGRDLKNAKVVPAPIKLSSLTAHIYKEEDQSSLPDADVRIITMLDEDRMLKADNDGNVVFPTPLEGFMIISAFQDYTGAFAGSVDENLPAQIPVPNRSDSRNALPVVLKVFDVFDRPIKEGTIDVLNKRTGEVEQIKCSNGLASFSGRRGDPYSVNISGEKLMEKTIAFVIDQSPETVTLTKTVTMSAIPDTDHFVVWMQKPAERPEMYFIDPEKIERLEQQDQLRTPEDELIEQDELLKNPELVQQQPLKFKGQEYQKHISIDPVYFEFNKAIITEEGIRQLDKLVDVLKFRTPTRLNIKGYADDRGAVDFNQRLSEKRAKAVKAYLTSNGIKGSRISHTGYGENSPVVDCGINPCTEEDHQQNRRAIFEMNSDKAALVTKSGVGAEEHKRFQDVLRIQGDKEADGVVFKITLGAYRLNHNLTFENLTDLGTVEKEMRDGITYYYLSGFSNLNKTESVRKEVIKRGVTDAGIRILYRDSPISLSKLSSLK